MRLLFLTTVLPHRKAMGSEVASQSVIEGLRAHATHVDVVGYLRVGDRLEGACDSVAVEARYIESRGARWHAFGWLLRSLVRAIPYSSAKYQSSRYAHEVRRLCGAHAYELAIIDHPQMGWIAGELPASTRLVFLAHNIEHQMYGQLAAAHRNPVARWLYRREARRIQDAERALATRAAEIWTLTAHDARHFSLADPGAKVRILPLPATSLPRRGQRGEKLFDLGLIGSWSWQANREGLEWFLREVRPRLPASLSVRVAGKGAERLVGRSPNLEAVGFVPDAIAFLQQARVVAIPTLSGGGIQIKTLDAIGSGSRIVATRCAVRGIDDLPATVTIADTAAEFVEALARAARDPQPAQALDAALDWSLARRDRFVSEMGEALRALDPRSLSPGTPA